MQNRWSLLVVLPLAACLAPPTPAPAAPEDASVDASPPPPRAVFLEVRDRNGVVHVRHEAPTWPRIRVTGDGAFSDPSLVVLTEAMDPDHLRADLRSPSLDVRTRALVVDTEASVEGGDILIEPRGHLRRGGRYLVGVDPAALDRDGEAFVAEITVSEAADAGAWATESWPADGTFGVPPSLPLLAVRFDGSLALGPGSLFLEGPRGVVPASGASVSCAVLGFGPGTCAELRPGQPLARGVTFTLRVDDRVMDRTGAPAGPFVAELVTATAPPEVVLFTDLTCAIDEQSLGPACALLDDSRLALRVAATGPARFFVTGGGRSDAAIAPRGDARLVLDGLPPGTAFTVTLRLSDLSLDERRHVFEASTTAPLAPLSIVEVRANPLGPEPAQEYVEVLNSGAMPLDLAGFRLADRDDREGDIISSPVLVPAGGRILLVSDAFDPVHPADGAVPEGVPLARVGASLASGGLSNSGEAVFLRDSAGRRVSAAPSVAVAPGACLVRSSSSPRRGDLGAFTVAPCTPGRPAPVRSEP